MKIDKFELTRKKLIIFISLAIGVIVLLASFIFYTPLTRDLKTKYLECRQIESQVADAYNIINSAKKLYKTAVLTNESEISQALDELTKHCSSIGINVHSIKPDEIKDSQAGYKVLPIYLQAESGYGELGEFLGALERSEKGLVKLRSFNLAVNKENKTKINAALSLDIYLSLE